MTYKKYNWLPKVEVHEIYAGQARTKEKLWAEKQDIANY
jgi:hypothetical protein